MLYKYSSYQIIVEKVVPTKRRRRDLSDLIGAGTTIDAKNSYITAEIGYAFIKNALVYKFKIGDKKQYNGYTNRPLKAETDYKVHVRATTKNGEVSIVMCSKNKNIYSGVFIFSVLECLETFIVRN